MSLQERLSQVLAATGPLTPLHLVNIRQELTTKRLAIANHRQELERLESECEMHELVLAPLRHLDIPDEILAEIFSHLVKDCDPSDVAGQVQRICLVCRRWRKVALASPKLWAILDVVPEAETSFTRVRKWLSRAGIIPRSLGIDTTLMGCASCGRHCTLLEEELVELLREAPLQRLAIRSEFTKCSQRLLNAVTESRSFDDLKMLELESWEWFDIYNDIDGEEEYVFRHLPQSLTYLRLELPESPRQTQLTAGSCHPSLPNLTSLGLTCEYGPLVLKSLGECPNLETLALDMMEPLLADNSHPIVPIPLPKLRFLGVHLRSRSVGNSLALRLMTCPVLTHLGIRFPDQLGAAGGPGPNLQMVGFAGCVTEFIHRSECVDSLRFFQLHSCHISPEGLLPILRELCFIQHLRIEAVGTDAELFQHIHDEKLLPRLEVLEVLEHPLPDFDYRRVIDLVEGRNKAAQADREEGVTPIQVTMADITIPVSESELSDCGPRLDALRDAGVSISLRLGNVLY